MPTEPALSDEEIGSIQERRQKATPGAWADGDLFRQPWRDWVNLCCDKAANLIIADQIERDFIFMVNCSRDVPALISSLNAARKTIAQECQDWAETDTDIRNLCRPHLTPLEVDGDKYSVPTMADVCELTVRKLESEVSRLRAELAELKASIKARG
jgi:hypothetical protein